MASASQHSARPIFIVSTGRSGSTILTWCLGQHPNIIPQEESNWLGPFAIDAAVGHRRGSARGERGQLSANFIDQEELLAALGDAIDRLVLSHRVRFENLQLRRAAGWNSPPFNVSRSPDEPKLRWVDGTPEYSLYICALRKLFPRAVFIHLVRDVTDVVRSLLNFFPDGKHRLVASEQAAYEYWLRRAKACEEAERAYGSEIVYRLRYVDLVEQPEGAIGSLLQSLGEPFAPSCLEPLAKRINTAEVPPDFDEHDAATDPELIKRARRLSEELQIPQQPREPSAEAAAGLESEFNRQVEHFATLEAQLGAARTMIGAKQNESAAVSSAPATEQT